MKILSHHISGQSGNEKPLRSGQGLATSQALNPGLAQSIVASPAVNAKRRAFHDGETIVDTHEPADEVFLIHRGQVRLYHDISHTEQARPEQGLADTPTGLRGERLVSILGPDDWFGFAAVAGKPQAELRAVTHGPAVVSSIDVNRLLAALADEPAALLAFTRDLAAKLEDACTEATSLMFDDCHRRLVRKLLTLSKTSAATAFSDGTIELRVTHHQIAQAIGVARESVSLCLGELRTRNVLTTGRNRVTFAPSDLAALL
ncbi:MAG: Crp/Fnr family transcriptional regulator [Planctomycetota bacterium]